MSIAQVVFDLPLEGPFDYVIPPSLENQVSPGMRVEVTLGFRKSVGLVIGILSQSTIDNLKHIKSVIDRKPVLDKSQLELGVQLSNYYGCSLGDALFAIVRGSEKEIISSPQAKPSRSTLTLHLSPSGNYDSILVFLIGPLAERKQKVLILAADQYAVLSADAVLKKHFTKEDYVIGMRSLVFRSLADIAMVIILDEDNSSFKQEQTPMYETRDVLLMRAKAERVDVAFLSTTPTVELMQLVRSGEVQLEEYPAVNPVKPQVVDLNNYKIMIKGILSPALLSTMESNLTKKLKTILVFNHRGAYAMTRCECGFVLKCKRCDSPVTYSRTQKMYLCRYCSFSLPGETVCPTCKTSKWKSFGLGIEQLQKALQDKFPLARIQSFERGTKELKDGDILIGTWALLRFKNHIKADLVAFLDIDSELNRLDMRSCFRAWSMVGQLRGMAKAQLLVQTRQREHYVMRSLAEDKSEMFYDEDMKIRRELDFAPFAHQVSIHLRGKEQKAVEKIAQELHHALMKIDAKGIQIHAPSAELIANKRGQYRLNILLQAPEVIGMIAVVKEASTHVKRRGKVLISINVDG